MTGRPFPALLVPLVAAAASAVSSASAISPAKAPGLAAGAGAAGTAAAEDGLAAAEVEPRPGGQADDPQASARGHPRNRRLSSASALRDASFGRGHPLAQPSHREPPLIPRQSPDQHTRPSEKQRELSVPWVEFVLSNAADKLLKALPRARAVGKSQATEQTPLLDKARAL